MVPFLKGIIKLDFPLCFRGVTFKTLQKQKITVGYRAWDLIVVVLSFDSNNSQWRFSRSSENIMHQIGKKTIYSIHYPDLLFVREQQKENSVCVWGKKKSFVVLPVTSSHLRPMRIKKKQLRTLSNATSSKKQIIFRAFIC